MWEIRYPPDERRRRAKEAELRAMRSKAQPLPAMEAEPELFEDLVGVVKAYGELQGDRVDGGLLPWAAASRWCSDHDIRGSERLRWCRLLVGMAMADVTERSKRRGKGGT